MIPGGIDWESGGGGRAEVDGDGERRGMREGGKEGERIGAGGERRVVI